MALARRRIRFLAAKGPSPQALLAALPYAVFVIGPEGRIEEVNAAAEMLFNQSESHLVGRSLAETVDLPARFIEAVDTPFAAHDIELTLARGEKVRIDVTGTPLPDPPGWRLMTFSGGTPAHRMEQTRLARADRSAEHVAAILAHEIKNPLSGVRGAAQLLEGQQRSKKAQALTTVIRTEVDRIAALIDQMQGFTDTRAIPCAPQNIYAVLDHVTSLFASGIGQDVVIRTDYDPSLPDVLVNRDALIQVLLNLLKNAAEAIDSADGKIRLTTAYRHGVSVVLDGGGARVALPIEVCVIDNGRGPPADLIDNLFAPFVTSKASGRGLGLALSDRLMRNMGGLIQFSREEAPPRTIFRLLLPRA